MARRPGGAGRRHQSRLPAGRLLLPTLAVVLLAGWVILHRPPAAPISSAGFRAPATPSVTSPAGAHPLLSHLSPGACMEYPPLHGDRHTTVFVDPGHGGVDPGGMGATSSGATVEEKNVTLAVGLDLLDRLRGDGYHVVMSRTRDATVARLGPGDVAGGGLSATGEHLDTEARVRCANAARAQLLIAIHMNAFPDPGVGGSETIYDSARSFATDSRRFAGLVQAQIQAAFTSRGWTVPDRGTKDDSTLNPPTLTTRAEEYGHLLELGPAQQGWLSNPSQMPGALTEPLFLTDPNEANVAATAGGQQAVAAGIESAINSYFGGQAG